MLVSAILIWIPEVNTIAPSLMLMGWHATSSGLMLILASNPFRSLYPHIEVDPWDLSKHINSYLSRSDAHSVPHRYKHFAECAYAIKCDLMRQLPVMACCLDARKSWHYVNIVAIKEDNKCGISECIALDSNQKFYAISYADMQFLMCKKDTAMMPFALRNKQNYHIIRFIPRN